MKYQVTVEGIDRIAKNLARAQVETPVFVRAALDDVGGLISQEVIRRITKELRLPREERTGKLVLSVFHSSAPDAFLAEDIIFGNLSDVPYSYWWEYGGSNKSPRGQANRKFVPKGRTVYPSVKSKYPQIMSIMKATAERVARVCAGA